MNSCLIHSSFIASQEDTRMKSSYKLPDCLDISTLAMYTNRGISNSDSVSLFWLCYSKPEAMLQYHKHTHTNGPVGFMRQKLETSLGGDGTQGSIM